MKTPWVVADSKKGVMRCDRCGEEQPLKLLEGMMLDFAAKVMKAFIDCHKGCKQNDKA